jgi:hypothetical protein
MKLLSKYYPLAAAEEQYPVFMSFLETAIFDPRKHRFEAIFLCFLEVVLHLLKGT